MHRARPGGERGTSIIELAFIIPVMAVLVFGVLDLGRAYRMQIRLEAAAREGAVFAQLFPADIDCVGDDDILGRAASEGGVGDLPDWEVTVFAEDASGDTTVVLNGCRTAVIGDGERIRVRAGATYSLLTPLIGSVVGQTLSISGDAEIEVLG